MRKIKYILAVIIVSLSMFSCFEDKTTTGVISNTVIVDTTGCNSVNGSIYVHVGGKLTIDPIVKRVDGSVDGLKYRWELSSAPGMSPLILVTEQKAIDYTVKRTPSLDYYYLLFTVTDTKNGVEFISYFPLLVSSPMGDGLIVADSKDDGATSDITFVKNKYVTKDYVGPTVYTRSAYSTFNGQNFKGKIKKISYNYFQMGRESSFYIHILSDKTLERIATSSYERITDFSGLFMLPPSTSIDEASFGTISGGIYFVSNKDLYYTGSQTPMGIPKFGDPINYKPISQIDKKVFVSSFAIGHPGGAISFLDPNKGVFNMVSASLGTASIVPAKKGVVSGAFEPTGFENYTQIASVRGSDDEDKRTYSDYHILKSPDGEIKIYGLQWRYDNEAFFETTDAKTTNACPEIASAKYFDMNGPRSVLYYATDSKVYAGLLTRGVAAGTGVYTAPAGETITCIQVYREAWSTFYGLSNMGDSFVPGVSHENMLLIATSDAAGNGKVYMLPITGASGTLGNADAENTLTGFGRISAIGSQDKQ